MTDTILDTSATNATLVIDGNMHTGTIDAVPMAGSFDTSFDHDWWAVNLTAGHDYAFSADELSIGLTKLAIDLSDSSRTILDGQGVVNNGGPVITYTALSSGTAYLDISAGSPGQTGNYGISVSDLGTDTILDTAATNATLALDGGANNGRINAVPENGSFDTSVDHDWWAVNLIAGHDYSFSAMSLSFGMLNVAIGLRDSSRTILNSQGVVDTGLASFDFTATSSGTAYLDISAGSPGQTGNYSITAFDLGADTVLDTALTTASLAMGATIDGRIDAVPESGSFDTTVDHDWFAVNLIAGHDYSFSTESLSLHDVVSVLRDSNRAILNSQGVVGGAFSYTAVSSGIEYLDVSAGPDNPAGPTGTYLASATDLGADTALDTASTSASIATNGLSITGRINAVPMAGSFDTSRDHDWYSVALVAGHDYTFSADLAPAASDTLNDVAIDLRDSNRNILNSQGVVDSAALSHSSFKYAATSSATEYFEIGAGSSSPTGLTGNYQISVSDDSGPDTILDTASTSASLTMGNVANLGTIDPVSMAGSFDTSVDHDWWAVNLTAGHDYQFYAQGEGGVGLTILVGLAIALRDSSRNILNSQGVVDNAGPRIAYTATSSGTAYLDISAGVYNPTTKIGSYLIYASDEGSDTTLDTASTNASLTMDGTATGRINGMPASGSFDTSLDHDWFAVNLVAGHLYTFSAQVIDASLFSIDNLNDVAIDLRDSNRNILNSQGVVDAGAHATSSFTYTATSSGTEYLDIGAGGSNPAGVTGTYQVSVTDHGLAVPTSLTINLIYDADALAAPQSFRDGMQAAANMLESAFDDKITVNIAVGYTEFGGVTLSDQNTSEANIGYGGTRGTGVTESYSNLRTLLLNHEGSADDIASVDALPDTTSLQGNSSFVIGTAQGKALGIVSPSAVAVDGQVGMGSGFTGDALIAAALHEITHAMGRISGDSLDLFRFNEDRSGSRVFGSAIPASPAYFSIDGGATDLADFGINSDPSDFLNGGVQGTDPFNEIVGGNSLTAADLRIMDVLGFHRATAGSGPDVVLDTASTNASLTMGGTTLGTIDAVPESGSFDTTLDHDWFAVSLIAGHAYTFSARAMFNPSENLNDVAIDLRDSSRTILDSQGVVDAGAQASSSFTYTATSSGAEYLDISAGGNNPASLIGSYQISVVDTTAPVLSNVAASATFTEEGPAATLSPNLTVSDVDSPNLASATVKITGGTFAGDGDVLAASTTGTGITASYSSSSETLTLSGTDTLAHYQQVLDTVNFTAGENPSNFGSNPTRTVTWTLNDGGGSNNLSVSQTATVNITEVNDPPVLNGVAPTATFTQSGAAITLSPNLIVSDADDLSLVSATVAITGGTFAGDGDVLAVSTIGTGITGSYNSASETLTLSGLDTLAHYQSVLDKISFASLGASPNDFGSNPTRTISWVVNDGGASNNLSAVQTTTVNIHNTPTPPVVTVSNLTATRGQSFLASTLFTASDPDGDTIKQYAFWDTGSGGGHFVLDYVAQAANQEIDVTAAQLSQLTYQSGLSADTLWVRASDGALWSSWSNAFTVTGRPDTPPVVQVSNVNAAHAQSFAVSNLFTASDPDGDTITTYAFWDTGSGGGHFVLNGTAQGTKQEIEVTTAQPLRLTYQSGSGADTLWVRVYDGTFWSAWSSAFTVTAPVDSGPVATVSNVMLGNGQTSVAASSLFGTSEADGDTVTQYGFWDTGAGGGHFLVNGVAQATNQEIFVPAAQLSLVTYQPGTSADTLWVQANDGYVWGAWSSAFTVSPWAQTPAQVTVSNLTANHGQSFAPSSLFTASDPDGDTITQYGFWDTGAGGGHFVLNGTAQGTNQEIDVTAAQLSQLSYQSGSGADTLWLRANDGTSWSNWSSAFTVTAPIDTPPVVTVSNLTANHGQSFAPSSLFTASDPDGDTITQYGFWDTGAGGGHFVLNGVAQGTNQEIDVTAAQLSQLSYQSGSGADTLWVRANDGTLWSGWSGAFTVTAPVDSGPVATVSNVLLGQGQISVAASSLFSTSEADGDTVTQYGFWDTGAGGGHFLVNGVAQATNQEIFVPAAQLSLVTYQPGTSADTLWVQANDGYVWGAWSSAFTVSPWVQTPAQVTVSSFTATHGQSFAASSLFTASDPDGDAITQYGFWDTGTGGGHFVLNGTAQGTNQEIDVTAAQLSQLSYQSGSGADTLWVRANDGTSWSSWSSAFTVTAPIDNGPTATVSNVTTVPGQTFAASSLFTASDPFGDAIATYDFWDTGAGGGQFSTNNQPLAANQDNYVSAAQLAQTTYQSGSGADTLWVRVSEGGQWSAWSQAFTVNGINPATVASSGTLELASNFSGTVTYSGNTGTLKIDSSSSFHGTIGGRLGSATSSI